ncbi:MAG: hypothetical protein U5L04_07235 [Trueperaceae bacterium]|nr:hypothetical protein [Trueperaceae bacterium]
MLLVLTLVLAFADEPQNVVDGRALFLHDSHSDGQCVNPTMGKFGRGNAGQSGKISNLSRSMPGYLPPLPTMFGFFAFALVSWLSARSLENALDHVRKMGAESIASR